MSEPAVPVGSASLEPGEVEVVVIPAVEYDRLKADLAYIIADRDRRASLFDIVRLERDALLAYAARWSANYVRVRDDPDPGRRWRAFTEGGKVHAATAEEVVRKAAGLPLDACGEPAEWTQEAGGG